MKKFWQLDYKQIAEENGRVTTLSEWGRIGRRFTTLEELLKYLTDDVCGFDEMEKRPLLKVDATSLEMTGTIYYDAVSEKQVEALEKEGKDYVKVVTTAKAYYLEEDEATIEDYLQMNDYVEVEER